MTFITDFSTDLSIHIPFVSHVTSIHLAEHSPSCLKFHDIALDPNETDLCRAPLYYSPSPEDNISPPELMSLKAYLLNGNDRVVSPKVLVCVRSIGPRKIMKPAKHEAPSLLIDVGIFDETDNCVLKIWEEKVDSVKQWKPNATILLLTNPTYLPSGRKVAQADIGLGFTTMVDVDPVFPDAQWLRQVAAIATTKERICIRFPYELWDVAEAVNGPNATLFTFAEIDDFVRDEPIADFTGKSSVIILDMNILDNVRKGRLCSSEWWVLIHRSSYSRRLIPIIGVAAAFPCSQMRRFPYARIVYARVR